MKRDEMRGSILQKIVSDEVTFDSDIEEEPYMSICLEEHFRENYKCKSSEVGKYFILFE